MSRFPQGRAFKRILRWTPNLSVPFGGASYTWVTLALTLPEAVDWTRTVLTVDGKSFVRQITQPISGGSATYGVIWKPNDANAATIYCKCGQTGTKTWTPECELWLLDYDYAAYHLNGNWDTANANGAFYTITATCGDAAAAARAVMWLPNMEYDGFNACICNDNAYVMYVDTPHRDASNNSCLTYKEAYGNSNIFYSFTYVYKR